MPQLAPWHIPQVHKHPALRAVDALVVEGPDSTLHPPLIVLGHWCAAEPQVFDHL